MTAKNKPVQEQFGQAIIDAVVQFAASDLERPTVIQTTHLAHISDAALQQRLSEVWYGARWIYKLGLALLVKDEEQMAHVRAQIIDYAAVCEGVLFDMVRHGIAQNILTGQKWRFADPARLRQPINWTPTQQSQKLPKMPLYWLTVVALEEGIITAACQTEMEWLRNQRNKVHVKGGSTASYLGTSMKAYKAVFLLIHDTKRWRARHP